MEIYKYLINIYIFKSFKKYRIEKPNAKGCCGMKKECVKNIVSKKSEIEKKVDELKKEIAILEESIEKEMIRSGLSFSCINCKKTVDKEYVPSNQIKLSLCYECLKKKKKEQRRMEIIDKIKFGRVIDIDFEETFSFMLLKSITIYKKGMMYELRPSYDDERESLMCIYNEWKHSGPEPEIYDEIKPWMKERKEKQLLMKHKKE